jgi:hypothetical protein
MQEAKFVNYVKSPFYEKWRRLNRGDLPTGVYKGQFIEQRVVRSRSYDLF